MFDKDYLKKIEEKQKNWDENTKNAKERDQKYVTDSGIPIKRLYSPLDIKSDYINKVGFPGEPPYTRGVYSNMYRGILSHKSHLCTETSITTPLQLACLGTMCYNG